MKCTIVSGIKEQIDFYEERRENNANNCMLMNKFVILVVGEIIK